MSRAFTSGGLRNGIRGFFVAEMGDKTQLATTALAARFDALAPVVAGTTVGMMLANVPAVWIGEKFAARIPMKAVRPVDATLFLLVGIITLSSALTSVE